MAGWFTDKPNALESEVYWFLWETNETQHPWAFKKEKAQRLIAALEMFASLVMVHYMLEKVTQGESLGVHLPFCTDNQGNAYCLLNDKTKTWPRSAILLEVLVQAQFKHVQLAPAHVRREYNTWADGLGEGKTSAFSKDMRLRPELNPPEWLLLNSLIALDEL